MSKNSSIEWLRFARSRKSTTTRRRLCWSTCSSTQSCKARDRGGTYPLCERSQTCNTNIPACPWKIYWMLDTSLHHKSLFPRIGTAYHSKTLAIHIGHSCRRYITRGKSFFGKLLYRGQTLGFSDVWIKRWRNRRLWQLINLLDLWYRSQHGLHKSCSHHSLHHQ